MSYTLYIGNKNYSTWSMRPWVLMKHFQIVFTEQLVRFDSFAADSVFKQTILPLNPYGTVPVLTDDDLVVSDSLAICEYLAERHPQLPLWPQNYKARARARSVVAKMHNGFNHIRRHFPMNIEAVLPEIGQIVLRDFPAVKQEIDFLDQHLSSLLAASAGKYLFGEFSIADAFYAPMCLRLKGFQIHTSEVLANYINTLCATEAVAAWMVQALEEKDFIAMDEPYRIMR
ncbi:glutathione S-transferase [Snodgrassella alvi]|uniref:glutathione S-transferase family protein n=1 Tax=Snodgrassella alvi TaxID=1196083 RepID=UPI000C1EDE7F|nr:glutathione S-transferase [Snodgrassella alvi]PIT10016.1 glutathione S-transferase [Snodgrassella alvi]PIT57319.1 glutathione S-transferase [Snodgrassella alvi]